jgi:signal transduction histidine kinase
VSDEVFAIKEFIVREFVPDVTPDELETDYDLLENGVRYNHLHGQLWVETGADAEHAWLVVANTGFEVEQADVPGLFEPFRRGGRERTGARGAGLGLAIVRAVCDAHGGTVSAVALDEGGLEVTVRLPAASATPIATAS